MNRFTAVHLQSAVRRFAIAAGLFAAAGCSGSSASSTKVYSGGGPLPEESEVLERLNKMPKTGRYAEEPPVEKSGKRVRRPHPSR